MRFELLFPVSLHVRKKPFPTCMGIPSLWRQEGLEEYSLIVHMVAGPSPNTQTNFCPFDFNAAFLPFNAVHGKDHSPKLFHFFSFGFHNSNKVPFMA